MCTQILHFESLWLLYIYLLFNDSIKEFCLHIGHLVRLPFHLCCKSYDGSNGGIPCYWRKSFFIVKSLFLRETPSHKPGFVFLYTSICCMLDLINLLWGDHNFVFRSWNHVPYIILHNRMVLFSHGFHPFFPYTASSKQEGSWSIRSHIKAT